ncbi:MAG: hypothetical protein ACYDAD_14140, partial [Acidimicrobiales bacterium]
MTRKGWVGWILANRTVSAAFAITLSIALIGIGVAASRSGGPKHNGANKLAAGGKADTSGTTAPGGGPLPGTPGATAPGAVTIPGANPSTGT